ncbi:MAG TPA: DEAD/DEAH box helicase [Microthrixaceae bacterium]|nr:DEAD/DEAH box helicase [Microthrixaceae bacterium]
MTTSIRLRPWQKDALEKLLASDADNFLAVATPGAGKTTFALTAAAHHLADRSCRGLVVVAPTQHLKLQWAESAHRLGLHLDHEWSARDGELPADMHGIVTTYQQVSTSAAVLRTLSAGAFVILDEVHHAGDDKSWGESVLTAFASARRRLMLSGTPFRSDTSAIPFVDYHLDEARPDFEYGYGDALTDGRVVRPVYFPAFGGHMEWVAPDGSEFSASFDDALDFQRANQRLRTALSLEGQWLPKVLAEAHAQLLGIRRQHPNAGGLVIAMDQEHAQGIARLMRQRFGVSPTIAVSDDPMASAKIHAFSSSTDPWIIAVRMVSEGVDIPRLRIGVFATNTTTELFFRQAVGRLVRWTKGVRSQKAFLFIPDDPRLRRWATGIAEQRRHSLKKRQREDDEFGGLDGSELDDRDAMEAADNDQEQMSLFAVISAVATEESTVQNSLFSDDHPDRWDDDDESDAVMDAALEVRLAVPPPPGAAGAAALPDGKTRKQLKGELRDANAELVRELVRFSNLDHRAVNVELNRLAGIRKITEATVEQLQTRLDQGNKWLRKL